MAERRRGVALNVLFFTPHAALWAHTAPEALLAKSLSKFGFRISYLTCGRAMNYCAVMTSRRLEPGADAAATQDLCKSCRISAKRIGRVYDFPVVELVDHISDNEREACARLAREATQARSIDTSYFDVPVGRLALYEFTLAHKKMSTELTDQQWAEYQVYLENALIALVGFANYFAHNRPDVVVAFSPQYSNINPVMQFAIRHGVRAIFIESGTNIADRLGTMRIWDWAVHGLVNPAIRYWTLSDLNRVSKESARTVTQHFRQLISGQHFAVFSPARSGERGLRERWKVGQDQRLVTLTMSSYDEAYAALLIDGFPESKVFSDVFRTQAEWLKATVAWARERRDVFLVIRVHPRDFPNKREQRHSEQSVLLRGILADVPTNVHVNWPIEGVSLYDLLDVTDVLTTGWSVTAMEALALGLPVVNYDQRLPSYPADIVLTGRSTEQYFANLNAALERGWDFANVRNGFRWMAYNFVECVVAVSRALSLREQPATTAIGRLWRRVRNKVSTIGQTADLLSWPSALPAGEVFRDILVQNYDAIPPAKPARLPITAEDEDRILRTELAALYQLLYPGGDANGHSDGLGAKIRRFLASPQS